MRPDELERRLRQRLDALGPAPRAELLHVLMLPDFERADRIGEFWSYPESRTFAELLIDCEEDRTLRAVLVDAAGGQTRARRLGTRSTPEAHGLLMPLSFLETHSVATTTTGSGPGGGRCIGRQGVRRQDSASRS